MRHCGALQGAHNEAKAALRMRWQNYSLQAHQVYYIIVFMFNALYNLLYVYYYQGQFVYFSAITIVRYHIGPLIL